jgi:TolA-binding protein
MDSEIPPADLKATEQIPEADTLYQVGLDLMRRGGHRAPVIYRQDRMIQAAEVFRNLIERYPTSDKIDDAAFWEGEIHSQYLPGQETLAAQWYERAWTWDPYTPHPARFRAAVVYDSKLHDRDRALELYQLVIRDETQSKRNLRHATRRIHKLTSEPGRRPTTTRRTARASGI